MAQEIKHSCENCLYAVEQPGFFRTKILCMAKADGRDPRHGGVMCPVFVARLHEQNAEKVIGAVTTWAKGQSAEDNARVPRTKTELELALAEAKERAAEARAEAAEARVSLLEARLKQVDTDRDTKE